MIKMQLPALSLTRDRKGHILVPTIMVVVAIVVLAFVVGLTIGMGSSYLPIIIIGLCAMIVLLVLRQHELLVVSIVFFHLYIDWYFGLLIIAPILSAVFLVILFLAKSPTHPWTKPRALWLWGLFLALAILPAISGALTRYDAAYYYPNIICGALLMFWLGIVIANDIHHIRRFFKLIAACSALLAIVTIVQSSTGNLIFSSPHYDIYLSQVSDFHIFNGSDVSRLGSYFVNPDWNGAFFAVVLCVPLGLFIESRSLLEKLLYLGEALLILPALLFTYSVGSWISAIGAVFVFIVLAGRLRARIWMILFLTAAAITLFVGFPAQMALLFQHGASPSVLSLRQGAWQTAIRIIELFPLNGIGMGTNAYFERSIPYLAPSQYRVLAHPHNSYLELGAMAGLPVIITFVALLAFALWLSLKNWFYTDVKQRALIGSGIAAVIALSINSLSVNAWTLPPLAALGWLILGVVSSPLLIKKRKTNEKQNSI